MAWQQISTQRTLLSSAVTLVLIGSTGISHALTIGATQVNSAQHEPLNAVIEVKDINPDDFSAKIADKRIYEQMELENNNRLNVNFVRTSATSGKLVVTSARPVENPYQNIVLDMSSGGQSTFLPKTLLLAEGNSNRAPKRPVRSDEVAQNVNVAPQVTISNQINLPTVSASSDDAFATTNVINPPSITPPVASDTQAINSENLYSQEVRVYQQNGQPTQKQVIESIGNQTAFEKSLTTVTNNDTIANNNTSTAPTQPANQSSANQSSFVALNEPPIGQLASDQILLNAIGTDTGNITGSPADDSIVVQSEPSSSPQPQSADLSSTTADTSSRTTYVVQRNDNLWIISNAIAKRNNISVYQVMKQIHQDNPNAFINGKANQLIANAELILPDYEVVPSQSSLEKALAAKRAQLANEQASASQSSNKSKKTSATRPSSKSSYQTKNSNTRSSTKPTNRVALVTPNAHQSQQSSSSGTGVSQELVSRLKSTRQSTASTVRSVNGLNDKFSNYSKKLEIQNDKIAQLEAKLKELKNK